MSCVLTSYDEAIGTRLIDRIQISLEETVIRIFIYRFERKIRTIDRVFTIKTITTCDLQSRNGNSGESF